MFKRVFVIINPASGLEEPILHYLNKALRNENISWEIGVTHATGDAFKFAKKALRQNYDLIAVYGGDGTVMEVAPALYKRKTPLLILPGGTANVMAKELGLTGTKMAINLIKGKRPKFKTIDMGFLGKRPFLIRLNLGAAAEMVKSTPRKSKEKLGIFAYVVSALKQAASHDIYRFKMDIDGKLTEETGIALMVANAGSVGWGGFSVHPHIKIDDGFLNVVVLKSVTLQPFFSWIKSNITGKKPRGEIKQWKGKKIKIEFSPPGSIICDDFPLQVKLIDAKVVPESLKVVVP